MPSADRPPPRACGAACHGRCGVLTVMWNGRRRAARLHGREMHATAERPRAVIGFRPVWPSWTSLICLEPLRALRVKAMTRFQRPIRVSLRVRCCTGAWASINALLHERLPLPLIQLSPAWSTPARFRANLTVSLLVGPLLLIHVLPRPLAPLSCGSRFLSQLLETSDSRFGGPGDASDVHS